MKNLFLCFNDGESSAYVSEAPPVMTESSREVTGAESVMAGSSREVAGVGAVKEELSYPDMDQPLEQTEQDGRDSNEREQKKMEKNGGLRPGRKWPQYLAANLGTKRFICHTCVKVS